jgi:CxxC-x17-CxxC domain-containing protein
MALADKTLMCRDCGTWFTFTVSEQEFYASRGWENEPSRCPQCRAIRRREKESYGYEGYSRPPRRMYPVICAACGKETEVPFEPKNDRPVYCSECYAKIKNQR